MVVPSSVKKFWKNNQTICALNSVTYSGFVDVFSLNKVLLRASNAWLYVTVQPRYIWGVARWAKLLFLVLKITLIFRTFILFCLFICLYICNRLRPQLSLFNSCFNIACWVYVPRATCRTCMSEFKVDIRWTVWGIVASQF